MQVTSEWGILEAIYSDKLCLYISVTINISAYINQHHISILIDLLKAFDTVNLRILLEKLEKYGIINRDLDLFKLFAQQKKKLYKNKKSFFKHEHV